MGQLANEPAGQPVGQSANKPADQPAGHPTNEPSDHPTQPPPDLPTPDRLAPGARPLVDALAAAFPDLGGTVTDAAQARRILDAGARSSRPSKPPLAVGSVVDRVVPGPGGGAPDLPVRIYLPDPEACPGPRPTVVFFHGGGYTLCGLGSHDATARGLCARAGAAVVSVAYRLAPEHRFPAAADDAYAALCWSAREVASLGGDPGALVTAGDSSGGGLATVAALRARDREGPAVALQVLIYPVLDAGQDTASYRENAEGYFLTAAHMRWFWQQYLGPDGDGTHPHASPLRAEPAGLPPAHLVTAGCDPLRDEGIAYARRLRAAGVPVTHGHHPEMFHGFLGFPGLLDEAETAVAAVAEAIASTAEGRKNSGEGGGCAG
ncbi:alpha/beta hydrolase fold domain-containing protein [Streptomyces kanamyceticus]|uniref:alpha/beta hydrolase fold domain-containing protein n=1 Tax=Streptomyces kanamyceticus TaxID=1967 RepID=UPI001CC3E95C|nr:alpha/beta hydrolase fold domain-containing protein [Streptomyces kanamyceticus]